MAETAKPVATLRMLDELNRPGTPFDVYERRLVEVVQRTVADRLDDLATVVEELAGRLPALERVLDRLLAQTPEIIEALRRGLAHVQEALHRGAAWIRGNPDVLQAVFRILVAAALAAYLPAAFATLAATNWPELLAAITTLAEALAA